MGLQLTEKMSARRVDFPVNLRPCPVRTCVESKVVRIPYSVAAADANVKLMVTHLAQTTGSNAALRARLVGDRSRAMDVPRIRAPVAPLRGY